MGKQSTILELDVEHIYWVIERELAGRPGPQLHAWTARELIQSGIGAVVSLAGPVRTSDLRQAGIKILPVHQPMILLSSEIERERFLEVMPIVTDFIDRCRAEQRGVLVHCHYGCDRTGAVLACYLLAKLGITPEEAIARVRAANPLALAADGYAESVTTFQRLLNQRSTKDSKVGGR
jgi:hypothetical protein